MQHPHCTSTTSRSVSPKLSCCLALYYACVALPIVRVVYELLAIVVMHLVSSSQCSLMYDEHHSKWHHYVQPKFAKEVSHPTSNVSAFWITIMTCTMWGDLSLVWYGCWGWLACFCGFYGGAWKLVLDRTFDCVATASWNCEQFGRFCFWFMS